MIQCKKAGKMRQINSKWWVERSALTKNVLQRKSLKKSVQKCNQENTDFSVKVAIKIISLAIFVNSANKSTPIKSKTMKT